MSKLRGALIITAGALAGGVIGLYYQSKEENRLQELRRIKVQELMRINAGTNEAAPVDEEAPLSKRDTTRSGN
ncbi:hypothetical protein EV182_001897 [Spiromyces aspiralis]|uniref:Uncharacterized protein n=1 Tax=Spiromyces aspiralis TaxID=68401 RepID=A0ACC1HW04_9FUNG|nr:hypothetical protein EV182_001897 [Spiromyces aspiralis]